MNGPQNAKIDVNEKANNKKSHAAATNNESNTVIMYIYLYTIYS